MLAVDGDRPADVAVAPVWARRWDARTVGVAVAAVVGLVAALVVTRRMAGFFTDDAYITMRIARNITNGDGWSYNVGD